MMITFPRHLNLYVALTVLSLLIVSPLNAAEGLNGFSIDNPLIPAKEILHGGPGKDGIPAINNPVFESVSDVGWLKNGQQLVVLAHKGAVKGYPLAILNWHEVVNDRFDKWPVVITYCPLCGSGMAFEAGQPGAVDLFGVSGLLYNSDVLLYDKRSDSLWSQLMSQAISGPRKGESLTQLPLLQMTWQHFKKKYPEALVLSRKTGFRRDYARNPYLGYEQSEGLYFPVAFLNASYHPKERVLGIIVDGQAKAYPFAELSKSAKSPLLDTVAGTQVRVEFDLPSRTGSIYSVETGQPMNMVNSFWFAWYGFNPETKVYKYQSP